MKVKLHKEECFTRTVVGDGQHTVFFVERRGNTSRSFYFTKTIMRRFEQAKSLNKMNDSFYQAIKIKQGGYVKGFLSLLDKDIDSNSNIIQPLSDDLINRAIELTKGMEVNLDEDFPEDFTFA